VILDVVLDRILDLLTTYTHDSELKAITAPPLITTAPAKLLQACYVFTIRSLVTASNCRDSSTSALKSFLNGGSLPTVHCLHTLTYRTHFQLTTGSFLHSLPYKTDFASSVVFLITPRYGPRRHHRSFSYAYPLPRERVYLAVP
jgi:hypothetical protein